MSDIFLTSFLFKKDIFLTKMLRRRKNNLDEYCTNSGSSNPEILQSDQSEYKNESKKSIQYDFVEKYNSSDFSSLVLSAAGTNIFKMIGILKFMQDQNKLKHITKYTGTSAGSFLTLCLVFDMTPSEIFDELHKIDFERIFSTANIQHVFTKSSLLPNHHLRNVYEQVILSKLGFIPTLVELHELTKKEWNSCVFNYTKYKVEYINHETHPNLLCSVAAVASSCVPFLFSKVQIGDDDYIDGGVCDYFPIKYHINKYPSDKILGVYIKDNINIESDYTPFAYLLNLFFIHRRKQYESYKTKDFYNKHCLFSVDASTESGFDFSMNYKDKLVAYAEGYKFIKDQFK
jgi:predicted acylesterase/phospholipase RssA